jgi:hypothetical protein
MRSAYLADVRRYAYQDKVRRTFVKLFLDNYGLQALLAYRFGRRLQTAWRRYYLWPLLPLSW